MSRFLFALVAALVVASVSEGQGCNGGAYRGAPPPGYGNGNGRTYGASAAPEVFEFRSPDGFYLRRERPAPGPAREYDMAYYNARRFGGAPAFYESPRYYAAAPPRRGLSVNASLRVGRGGAWPG